MVKSVTRVALYARVSTTMQAEADLSIPAQIAEMKAFTASRGWMVALEFVDAGYSGTKMERPSMEALLEAADAGGFDILLVHELSRLSRNIFDTFEIFDRLGKAGVGFASVKEPHFDFSTTGRFFLTIMAAINQYYVDLLRMHVAKAKHQRAREGLYNASRLPYGYLPSSNPKIPPLPNPETAPAVKLAFETYADGKHSFQDVADALNYEGFRTPSGRKFTNTQIDEILHNRFYTGVVVYGKRKKGQPPEVFAGLHDPIISTELFEQVEAMRKQRYVGSRSLQSHWRVYLLNGIVYCDACGRRLRAQTTKTGSYYREVSNARGYFDCPDAKIGARTDLVHDQISAIVRDIQLPDDWLEQLQELLEDEDTTVSLDNQRARLEAELRRVRELYKRGYYEDDIDTFERDAQAIQRQLDQLPKAHDLATIEEAAATLNTLADVWDDAELEEQRDLLRLALAEVYVDVRQSRITSLRPHTPFIPLFRQLDSLIEIEPGRFAPLFSPEIITSLAVEPVLPEITTKPLPAQAPLWPIVMSVPPGMTGERISPILSETLKAQRKDGVSTQHVVDVPHPGFPRLETDPRKWPGVTVETYEWTGDAPPRLALKDHTVTFLHTPFTYQLNEFKQAWLDEAERLLAVGGRWWLYDIAPEGMPGFWLFRFFPTVGQMIRATAQPVSKLYLVLQEHGWEVSLKRQAYYQAVSVSAAMQIAKARDKSLWLVSLSEKEYQAGLKLLKEEFAARGESSLLPSHICVIEGLIERKV